MSRLVMTQALAAGALATALLAHPAYAATETTPQIHTGASASVKAWSAAMEAGDVAAVTRMYGAQTVVLPADKMVAKGTDAARADFSALLKQYNARVQIDEGYYMQVAQVLTSWGLFTLTLTPKVGGTPVVMHGRYTDVATQVNGQWQYIVDHASVPAKAP